MTRRATIQNGKTVYSNIPQIEIEEELLKRAERVSDVGPLLPRLSAIFESIPRGKASAGIRGHFRLLQAAVRLSLEASIPDIEAAKATIQGAALPNGQALPVELEAYRTALLDEFNK